MVKRLTGVKLWWFRRKLSLALWSRRYFNVTLLQSEKVTQAESFDDAFESGFSYLQTTYTRKSITFDRVGYVIKWWEAYCEGVRFDGFVWEESFRLPDESGQKLLKKTKEVRMGSVIPKRKLRRTTA